MLSHSVTTTAPGKSSKYDEIARRLNSYMLHRGCQPGGRETRVMGEGGLSDPPLSLGERSKFLLDAR